ncbi:unnamed protein product [Ceratitis capitata]|uniref:(Mediterranean fruit fly) hypothetical protein n=1 Tax=Ceratitis capitata TaxID=7213 RepID=A0A811V799_CERCA|nr:unnamed protein product [Ceratitis capitata]
MRSVLVHSELWPIVCGKCIKNEEATAAESAAFDMQDEKALASIMLSIKPSQLNHVKHSKTSLEAWNSLREVYQPSGPARKITLFKKLLYLRKSEGNNMKEHISEFYAVLEQLNEIGVIVPEEMLTIILLSSLNKSFENFVVAIETRDTLPSLSALKIKLLEEGERRLENSKDKEIEDSEQALVARAGVTKNDSYANKNKSSDKKYANIKCFKCGKRGHIASKCNDVKKLCSNNASLSVLASATLNNLNRECWIIDSGATSHLCCERDLFSKYKECEEKIMLADAHCIEAIGVGEVNLKCGNLMVKLQNVLHVPSLKNNFLSVSKFLHYGLKVYFEKMQVIIKTEKGEVLMRAKRQDGLYVFRYSTEKCCGTSVINNNEVHWHNRFGHLNFESLAKMANENIVYGLKFKSQQQQNKCVTCARSKICVKKFPKVSENRAEKMCEVIHTDVCGPINIKSLGGSRYFVTFIDDMSRYICVYFMKSRDEVFSKFKMFKEIVEKQNNCKIKVLRSDNGREYLSREFGNYLKENGIVRQLTVPHTPQQNGVAERANRTLVEMARSMLIHSESGECFWAEAVSTAAYLRNRAITKALTSSTPFEKWTGKKPCVSHFKVFGSLAIALDKTHKRKFQPKGKKLIMVGYSETSKAYRLYDPVAKTVIVSRDVIFVEDKYPGTFGTNNISDLVTFEAENQAEERTETEKVDNEDPEANEESNEQSDRVGRGRPKFVRTGKRGRPRKKRNMVNLLKAADVEIPNTVIEAMNSKYSHQWEDSMQKEYSALIKNDTWSLVDLPPGQKAIGCKWVFNVKQTADGGVERFKSRLVAKGCSQQYGVNFSETYSPVVRYATIRMLLALAAEYKLFLHQMDVSTAYLNSDLHDIVYMKQPEHFIDKQFPKRVLQLKKALYGLKQSGREWNSKLESVLIKMNFKSCPSEPCVYTRNEKGKYNIIAVYVDDLIIASSDMKDLSDIKAKIADAFDVVDGGSLKYFLGMEIEREGDVGSINICQSQYILNMLSQYGMENCKSVATPLEAGFQTYCDKEDCERVNVTQYQSLIGALMYLAISTRPDILHSVSKLAQRNSDPHVEHKIGAKRIMRYLKGTVDYKLHYQKTGKPIQGYVDADWGGDTNDRKSYTGCAFVAAGSVFSWESKKQNLVSLSSTEAEYVALSTAAKEAVYIKKLMNETGFNNTAPMVLNSDNQSAQQLVKNPIFHSRSKHIDIKYHHIRNLYRNKEIELNYICTNEMLADILTKNLQKIKHNKFTQDMGLY